MYVRSAAPMDDVMWNDELQEACAMTRMWLAMMWSIMK
jgi:hypothetical protein